MNVYYIQSMPLRRFYMIFVTPIAFLFLVMIAAIYTAKQIPSQFTRHFSECTYGLKNLIINAWKYKKGQNHD